jgi:hypothetical protein
MVAYKRFKKEKVCVWWLDMLEVVVVEATLAVW